MIDLGCRWCGKCWDHTKVKWEGYGIRAKVEEEAPNN